jgi:hypothetical protein
MQRFGVNEQDANIPDAPARALPLPVQSDERPFDLSSDLSSLPDLIRDGDYTTTFEASVDDMMDDTTVASSIADAVKSYRGGRPDRKKRSSSLSLAPEQKRPKVGEPKV